MQPAIDPAIDYKALVQQGYDRCLDHSWIGHGYDDTREIPAENHPLIFAQAI